MDALLEFDQKLFLLINGWSGSWFDIPMISLTYLGRTYILIPTILLFMLIFDRKNFIKRGSIFFLAVVAMQVVVSIAKIVFMRLRPEQFFLLNSPGELVGNYVIEMPESYAFPSAHATIAFVSVIVLNYLYRGRFSYLYPVAILIAFSRIYLGVHFPLDVAGGILFAVLGGLSLKTIAKRSVRSLAFKEKAGRNLP